ncbi:putative rlpA-like protein, double-psi beta-barrel [Helianthus annuus]|uniref:Expansin/Lol pI, expansin, cellulose-binding-like domain superfamily n=1 Tax=Helianthus annuus TaxID=4232 RepID=A0A251T977_HELAN|nr:expansin-like B1 [Helianthus annuus]KAF5759675.1 putative expansin/Lol pI, expansin, cellulose-binding-like domain superfamily [Helianthus annuus]KAJ0437837.1 putative rlpA-like protein, double-psi beta-barrel [Helianthus annuus]KAJ0442404.1 putative rlpA-like protein, double-psi beta-barrel [Helianthus annuus]KAJ0460162.1 putative rlpA-like protein, double-psi beta-barrel [Helianthus annuus]KAJ0640602.1 putative rlpA-like protein, double-psi beta-barrel [Helianthus annuus]
MGLTRDSCHLFLVLILVPSVCYSQDSFVSSRATYYGSLEYLGTPTGACGYKEYGSIINGGEVTAVSYKLFKDGAGCGACYQVRCKYPPHCNEDGTRVVATDHGEGDNTDFILSTRAYNKLALPGQAEILFSYGVVDVEYKRIPCQYPGYNLVFKVHEHSNYPKYLALIAIYQGGVSEITRVELWQEDCKEWRCMRRAYGAVWDMQNPPEGAIDLRFQVSGSKWIQLKSLIPSDWKVGATYNTAVQLD